MPSRPARLLTVLGLALAALLLFVVALTLALREPVIDLRLLPGSDGRVQTVDRWLLRQPLDWHAVAWRDADGIRHPIDAALLVEEPDQLPDYASWNGLLAASDALWQALQTGSLRLIDEHGEAHRQVTRERRIGDLPLRFWAQFAAAGLALLGCLVAWTRATDRVAAWHLLLSGCGFYLAATTASIYSSRELALDRDSFYLLTRLNLPMAMLMAAGIAVLLWRYPSRLIGRWRTLGLYALAFGSLPLVWLQWPDAMATVIYTPQALLLALVIAGCIRQWQAGRTDPGKRRILSAYLLALVAGTPVSVALVMLPLLTGGGSAVSQTLMFVSFVPGYLGLAFGLSGLPIVDLGRWWFTAWTWFLTSTVLGIAWLVLGVAFGLQAPLAIAWSVAIVGLGFHPARRALAGLLADRPAGQPERLLPEVLAELAEIADPAEAETRWRTTLAERYAALAAEPGTEPLETVALAEQRHALEVPGLTGNGFRLRYPDGGARLFGERDRRVVTALHAIARQQMTARLRSQRTLAEERNRLRRELAERVRPAVAALRARSEGPARSVAGDALHQIDQLQATLLDERARIALDDVLDGIESATRTRCAAAGLRLRWQLERGTAQRRVLSPRAGVALERAVLEAVANALRHGQPTLVAVAVAVEPDRLRVRIQDDGGGRDPVDWLPGDGMRRVTSGISSLGGDATWHTAEGGIAVRLEIPL